MRLKEYSRNELESLQVTGEGGIRAALRAEMAAGNLPAAELEAHGIHPGKFGVWVGGCGKAEGIALLLGEAPAAPEPAAVAPAAATALPAVPAAAAGTGGDGMAALAAMIRPHLSGLTVDPEAVRAIVLAETETEKRALIEALDGFRQGTMTVIESAIAGMEQFKAELLKKRPVEITVTRPSGERRVMDRQHFLFPLILAAVSVRIHPYLVGPAGSGKTTVCHKAANELELEFDALSVCQQSTKTDLLGYMDAVGVYRETAFRRLYENGGVFVLDEVDNGNANVLAVLNGALANDAMTFPDKRVARHADFVLIACGNTYGGGADRLYVGRNQLDAATLDRFAFLDFPYDEGFELEICGVTGHGSPACDIAEGGKVTADEWVSYVQRVRAAVQEVKARHVVSPRASIYGVKLASAGIGRAWLERLLIWKGLGETDVTKIKAAMK